MGLCFTHVLSFFKIGFIGVSLVYKTIQVASEQLKKCGLLDELACHPCRGHAHLLCIVPASVMCCRNEHRMLSFLRLLQILIIITVLTGRCIKHKYSINKKN